MQNLNYFGWRKLILCDYLCMTATNTAQSAIRNAIEFYANSLGVSVSEAVELYKNHESTQQCIQLLVLAQANPEKLKAMAATM